MKIRDCKQSAPFTVHGFNDDLQHIVLHENAGNDYGPSMYHWLNTKRYGYHFTIDRSGLVRQHNDINDRLWHGGQCNKTGIAICICNAYYPHLNKDHSPEMPAQWWTHVLKNKPARYVRPTIAQIDALDELITELCFTSGIRKVFPTAHLNRKQRRIKKWWARMRPESGIVAHRDYAGHSDGRWPLEQIIKRNETPKFIFDYESGLKMCASCGQEIK